MRSLKVLLLTILFSYSIIYPFLSFAMNSIEPTYCNPSQFKMMEIKPPSTMSNQQIYRLHLFQLGQVVVAGMGIGESSVVAMEKLAKYYSSSRDENIDVNSYCTWFVGSMNETASRVFNYRPIPEMYTLNIRTAAPTFMNALETSFFTDPHNFIDCARTHGYLALGCDLQMHRGPTVFGMLLAFSGCTPEHAHMITNSIWGLNGVRPAMRLSIIQAAYDLGNSNPIFRDSLANIFLKN